MPMPTKTKKTAIIWGPGQKSLAGSRNEKTKKHIEKGKEEGTHEAF